MNIKEVREVKEVRASVLPLPTPNVGQQFHYLTKKHIIVQLLHAVTSNQQQKIKRSFYFLYPSAYPYP